MGEVIEMLLLLAAAGSRPCGARSRHGRRPRVPCGRPAESAGSSPRRRAPSRPCSSGAVPSASARSPPRASRAARAVHALGAEELGEGRSADVVEGIARVAQRRGVRRRRFALPGIEDQRGGRPLLEHGHMGGIVALQPRRARGAQQRHNSNATPAQPRPASAPNPNANWFTLCPANILCSVAQGAGGLWGPAHSFGSRRDRRRHPTRR